MTVEDNIAPDDHRAGSSVTSRYRERRDGDRAVESRQAR